MAHRVRDAVQRGRTDLSLHAPQAIALVATAAGVAAGLATSPHTRSDANGQQGVFVAIAIGLVATLGIYVALSKRNASSFAASVCAIGCLAALAGAFQLPLWVYPWLAGVAIAAFVHTVGTLVAAHR